jgi:histidinol-phosphate/aromatic aminotransferase/cobyric acid decarboxylase-like protein
MAEFAAAILIVGRPSAWAQEVISALTAVSSRQIFVEGLDAALEAVDRNQPRLIVVCRGPGVAEDGLDAILRAASPASRLVILDDAG